LKGSEMATDEFVKAVIQRMQNVVGNYRSEMQTLGIDARFVSGGLSQTDLVLLESVLRLQKQVTQLQQQIQQMKDNELH